MDLGRLTLRDMLAMHAGIGAELKRRGISRTGNNPCADFAEYLVSKAFGWQLNPNSSAGFDAMTEEGQKVEIKARRLAHEKASRQVSAIRKIETRPFDYLVGVVFAEDYSVIMGVKVPFDLVFAQCSHVTHTNSAKFNLRDSLLNEPGVSDITQKLSATALQLLEL